MSVKTVSGIPHFRGAAACGKNNVDTAAQKAQKAQEVQKGYANPTIQGNNFKGLAAAPYTAAASAFPAFAAAGAIGATGVIGTLALGVKSL